MPSALPASSNNRIDASFGNWIKRRRKTLDLTQRDLANRVGCSPSLIFKIESDERRPSREIAELLAQHLEIPQEQRGLFLRAARQEKQVEHLENVSTVSYPEAKDSPISFLKKSKSSLPVPLTPIVGREHELQAIFHQIQNLSCRLLTLTGPGGVGKTRLALEVAHQLDEVFDDGAYFVALAGTNASEFIIPAIADSFGFVFSATSDSKLQLFNYLRQKQTLIVLDNLEHLLDGIEFLDELLAHAKHVKLLTTSREPINLRAEWIFEVQGLPIPSMIELDHLEANSAASLFFKRAKQANMHFSPGKNELMAIRNICHLVEGLPLGLELAASWIRTLSPQEIAQEIENNMDFLTATARDVPPRHRSIRAVFDYSWVLLSEEEQNVMGKLSIFRGGFTREAAERVTDATLLILSSLVDKSLVRRNGTKRYDLHELIRQYAYSHLKESPSEEENTRQRHANYYFTLLQKYETALLSHHQKIAVADLGADIDNLRVAWNTNIESRQFEHISMVMFPLWRFYDVRNYSQEGLKLFSHGAQKVQALLISQETQIIGERAKWEGVLGDLLAYWAYFTRRMGNNNEAVTLYESSLNLLRTLNEPSALSNVLTGYGVLCNFIGRFEKARQYMEEALELFRLAPNEWQEARCMALLGSVVHEQGDYVEASKILETALRQFRKLGDPRYIAITTNFFSRTLQAQGRLMEIGDILQESLHLSRETGDQLSIGMTLERMAVTAHLSGDETEAQRLFVESVQLFRDIADPWSLSRTLNLQGYFSLEINNLNQAQTSFKDSFQAAVDARANPNLLDALTGLAILKAQKGQYEQAFEWLYHVLQRPSCSQDTKERAVKLSSTLEKQLDPQRIKSIKLRTKSTTIDTLVSEVLASLV